MDEDLYERATEFMPERFLQSENGFRSEVSDREGMRRTYAFGAGRCICPGSHLTENSLVSADRLLLERPSSYVCRRC